MLRRPTTEFDSHSNNDDVKLCFKFLAPTHLVTSIMGPKGKVIQGIQAETNTVIQFSDRGFNYTNTRSRLATVIGYTTEDLVMTLVRVIERLNECKQQYTNYERESSATIPWQLPDSLVFYMIIPKIMRGIIIGAGGSQVAELREMSGCKIRIDEGMTPMESMLKIGGVAEGILKVCEWVIDQIPNVCTDESFRVWSEGPSLGKHDISKLRPARPEPVDYQNDPLSTNLADGAHTDGRIHGVVAPQSNGARPLVPQIPQIQTASNIPPLNAIIAKVGAEVNSEQKTFSLQIPIPLRFKGALIGKGGCGVKDILHTSLCTTLDIQDIQGTEDCSVTIEGSVMACSAAYLLVMRQYIMHSRLAWCRTNASTTTSQ